MDNRTGRSDREPGRYVSEVGTDTVPVNLVEIQSVGRSSPRSPLPLFLVGIAVVGIIAFALGGSLATPPVSSPAPTSGAAISTPSGIPATSSPRPRATVVLRTAEPAPTPAPTFPWTWSRTELPEGTFVAGIWGTDDRLLMLERLPGNADDDYDLQVNMLVDNGEWRSTPAPPAIAELLGGSVVDDRVWFVARVEGITEADRTWQLVSTDGESWDSRGVSEGLGPVSEVSSLRRFRGTWVANVWGFQGSDARLLWSGDGRAWHVADLPAFEGNVEFWQVAALGDRMLVLGREFVSFEDVEMFVLSSTDGKAWKRSPVPLLEGHIALQLSCSADVCVIPIDPREEDGTEREVLVTANGRDWSGVMLDLPMLEASRTIELIQPAGGGFVGMGGASGFAFLSPDGRDWVPVQVMPADHLEFVPVLAVSGDRVVAYAPASDSSVQDSVWQGSISEMRKG